MSIRVSEGNWGIAAMTDQLAAMSAGRSTPGSEVASSRTQVTKEPERTKWAVVVHGDAWPRARATSRELASLISAGRARHADQEITLSGKQLLIATGSVFCSIFLLVWALTKLWLAGR